MTIQDIQNVSSLQCPKCSNRIHFKEISSQEDFYLHYVCEICRAIITAFKENKR